MNKSGIHIKPENKGKFTASAKRAGMGVQSFASKVLANKGKYSSTLVKRANFAKNAAKWKHEDGGVMGDDKSSKWKKMVALAKVRKKKKYEEGGVMDIESSDSFDRPKPKRRKSPFRTDFGSGMKARCAVYPPQ